MHPGRIPAVLISAAIALATSSCGPTARVPRPTVLTAADPPPPPPPPEANEERLEAVALTPASTEPIEVPPGNALGLMARRALDTAQPDLIDCYEAILGEHPDATGSVEVQIDLANDGSVSRVVVDQLSTGGFEAVVPCVRATVAALRVHDVESRGHYVSRVYSFRNAPIQRLGSAPVIVTAPPPPPPRARRGRGRAAPIAAASPAPSSPPPATTAVGALEAPEIASTLTTQSTGLQECYRAVLRRARGTRGVVDTRFDVTGRGAVEHVEATSRVAPLAGASACIVRALTAVPFRASGVQTHIQQAITFQP